MVEFGGADAGANIRLSDNHALRISNSTIRKSLHHGIIVENYGEQPAVIGGEASGNLIADNAEAGVLSTPWNVSISNNTFSGNGSYPLVVPAATNLGRNTFGTNGRQAIRFRGATIQKNLVWKNHGIPYEIESDVVIATLAKSPTELAVLSIEPGVVMRFEPRTKLRVGFTQYVNYKYYGGLVAQGSGEQPIVFTSNAPAPAPGDWAGVIFEETAGDDFSILEHCRAEYADSGLSAENTPVTLRRNIFQHNRNHGVYLFGSGSQGSVVECNAFLQNAYGLRTADGAGALIARNHFTANTKAGLFNNDPELIEAVDNWWGDPSGPNAGGDKVLGNVDFTPWLTTPIACEQGPPLNLRPYYPSRPQPGNGATQIPLVAENSRIPVTLAWSGGDPNHWDAAVYDLHFGTSADSLTQRFDGLDAPGATLDDLQPQTTYYWQVTARDLAGLTSQGPVWSFTTASLQLPDLKIKNITWTPAENLSIGQPVLITITVENAGAAPASSFSVLSTVSNRASHYDNVGSEIPAGGQTEIKWSWTAYAGVYTITVTADYESKIAELSEVNNQASVTLPPVADTSAPQLDSTNPYNGTLVNSADPITFRLYDTYGGTIDDSAVKSSVVVTNDKGEIVAGSVSEFNDTFTFTPAARPLPDETYKVRLTASDIAGNSAPYSFTFTLDATPPPPPAVDPIPGTVFQPSLLVKGTKEAFAAILLGTQTKIGNTDQTGWSFYVTLTKGVNNLVLKARDRAGNLSAPTTVAVVYDDSAPPAVTPPHRGPQDRRALRQAELARLQRRWLRRDRSLQRLRRPGALLRRRRPLPHRVGRFEPIGLHRHRSSARGDPLVCRGRRRPERELHHRGDPRLRDAR